MTSRRDLLRGALAATLPLGALAPAEASLPLGKRVLAGLGEVVYEAGSGASVAFARSAARAGAAVRAIERDVTALWYRDLYYRWRDGAGAVAGLTTHGALFCLEQLAWDHRLRVVFRGRHRQTPDEARHLLEGPARLLRSAASAWTPQTWPESIADMIMRFPDDEGDRDALDVVTPPSNATSTAVEELYSWVIARPARPRRAR